MECREPANAPGNLGRVDKTVMLLSIVVVSWNTRELLAECLESILKDSSGIEHEVFVVDNASTDGSQAMVEERFPTVNLIQNPQNFGFAKANNQALRQSAGKYILLLNSDTQVLPGAIGGLFGFMEKHSSAGAAGARLLNRDGSLQFSCSPEPSLWREVLRLFHFPGVRPDGTYSMAGWDLTAPQEVDTILGACIILRRSILDQIGLFDEDFFMYSEEVDLCTRIRRAGWSIYWAPQSKIVHYGGQSTGKIASDMSIQLYKSKILYFRKHYPRWTANLYKSVLWLAASARLALTPFISSLEKPDQRARYLALAANYRQLREELPAL